MKITTMRALKEAFLLDPDIVFLNHGSYAACPKDVMAEHQRWLLEAERNPVEFFSRRSAALLAHARQRLAAHVGTSAADLVFVPNATTGVNTVARSLDLRAGDEVIGCDHEYGACEAALRLVCRQAGAVYRTVPVPLPFDAGCWTRALLDACTPRTRLILASHMASRTALIFPVAGLCTAARRRGILTLIDGAHAPGHIALDIDAIGADFYTGNCHKWLCAPKGSAFLQVKPEHQARLDATVISWGYLANDMDLAAGEGGADTSAFDGYTGRGMLERRVQWQGTRDIAGWLSVPAAIDFQQRHDWPAVRERCHAMACQTQRRVLARNGLQPVAPDAAYGQMVTIPVRCTDGPPLQRWLWAQHRIEVPVTQHNTGHGSHCFVRVSVQAYNDDADLETLVGALKEAGV